MTPIGSVFMVAGGFMVLFIIFALATALAIALEVPPPPIELVVGPAIIGNAFLLAGLSMLAAGSWG